MTDINLPSDVESNHSVIENPLNLTLTDQPSNENNLVEASAPSPAEPNTLMSRDLATALYFFFYSHELTRANRYGFFKTAIEKPLTQAAAFSIGAAIHHHPVRKGALTALAGGPLVGAVVGLIGSRLGIKNYDNSDHLEFCSLLLDMAALVTTMPLGTIMVPFEQNLPQKTQSDDQFLGCLVLGGIGLLIKCLRPILLQELLGLLVRRRQTVNNSQDSEVGLVANVNNSESAALLANNGHQPAYGISGNLSLGNVV
jgi:hypothetical protein